MAKSPIDLGALLRRARASGDERDAPPETEEFRALPAPGDLVVAPRRAPRPTLQLRPALERARAFAARSIAPQVVAASLEGTTLRLISYTNQRILGWGQEPLGDRSGRGGQINDPVALGAILDETFDRLQIPRRRVAWALPAFQATCRLLDLPRLQGEELRLAVEEEAERALGVSSSDCFLYSQRLAGRIRQRHVFVLAVPKSTVLTALEALDVAGIRPWTMDLRPIALARAVGRPDAIVANLEEGSLDLVIVDQSVPTLVRSLPLPASAAFDRDAAQERLIGEIERTLAYYDESNPDQPLDPDVPLYLTGNLASGIALAERVRAATRRPIGRLTGLPPHPDDLPVTDYLVNVGLALKQG